MLIEKGFVIRMFVLKCSICMLVLKVSLLLKPTCLFLTVVFTVIAACSCSLGHMTMVKVA